LLFFDGLNPGADDLGDVGAFEHRKADHTGQEVAEQPDRTEQHFDRRHGARRSGVGDVINTDQRHELTANEEIKNKNEHDRRDIPDQLDIDPAHGP
jgi:hypothetical protein